MNFARTEPLSHQPSTKMRYRQTYSQYQRSMDLERHADRLLGETKPRKQTANFGVTVSAPVNGCNCDVLPWEDCEHTEAAANSAMSDMLGKQY